MKKSFVIGTESTGQVYKITLDPLISVDTPTEFKSILYPNPVNNFIYLISDNYNKYEIIDLNGLVISEGNFKSVIDMSNVNSGMYFIRFYFENDVITKKIIKE